MKHKEKYYQIRLSDLYWVQGTIISFLFLLQSSILDYLGKKDVSFLITGILFGILSLIICGSDKVKNRIDIISNNKKDE